MEDEESKRTHKYPLKIPVAEKLLGAPNLMVWGWLLRAETVSFEAVRLTLYLRGVVCAEGLSGCIRAGKRIRSFDLSRI